SSLLSFFFTDPSPSQIYTLSLHDALPIYFLGLLTLAAAGGLVLFLRLIRPEQLARPEGYRNLLEFLAVLRTPSHPLMPSEWASRDRKSTRLNSSHVAISYAVFCLKKKKKQ